MHVNNSGPGGLPSRSNTSEQRREHSQTLHFVTQRFYPILRSAGLSRPDCEEVISTVCFKYIQHRHTVHTSPMAFLFKIASRELSTYIRKNNTLKVSQVKPLDDPEQLEMFGEHSLQYNLELEDLLNSLIPRQQDIVKLLLSGFSQVEIAVKLDIKPSTVSYHIKNLRESDFIQELLNTYTRFRREKGNSDG